jgi:GAF domain-containing protein
MDSAELRRLVVRHRHVAPMLSVVLAATDARVTITDLDGAVLLDRQSGGESAGAAGGSERHPIVVDGETVGWVNGPRPAGAIGAVLSYAGAREADKRALAREALDRYRELNLLYDLADDIGATLETDAVARVAVDEASKLQAGGRGFVRLLRRDGAALDVRPSGDDADPVVRSGTGILGGILGGDAEIVNDIPADPRATDAERMFTSVVAAPLRVRGERIGVIGAISREPIQYRASDLRLIEAIGSLAAPTFDQAAVHEATVASRATG